MPRGEAPKTKTFSIQGASSAQLLQKWVRRVWCCLATAHQPGSGSSLMGNAWGHHLGTVSHPHQASFPISKMKCPVSTRFGKTGIVRLGSRTRSQLHASGRHPRLPTLPGMCVTGRLFTLTDESEHTRTWGICPLHRVEG